MKYTLLQLEKSLAELTPDTEFSVRCELVRHICERRIQRQPGRVRKLAEELLTFCPDDVSQRIEHWLWFAELYFRHFFYRESQVFFQQAYDSAHAREDTGLESMCLERLGKNCQYLGNFGRSLRYYRLLLDLYQRLEDPFGIGHSLAEIGDIYWHLGEYSRANDYQMEAMKLAEGLDSDELREIVLTNFGAIKFKLGNLEEALDYHLRSLSLNEKHNHPSGIANSFSNIGIIHRTMHNLTKALEFHQKAIIIYESLLDRRGISKSLLQLGLVYQDMGDNRKTLESFYRAMKLKQQIRDHYGLSICHGYLGNTYLNGGEFPLALQHFYKALALAQDIWDKWQISHISTEIGVALSRSGEYTQARQYFEQGLKIAWEISSKELISRIYSAFTDFYTQQRQYADALAYFKKFIEIRDSLQSEQNHQRILELQSRHELEKREQEAQLARSEAENAQLRNQFLLEANRKLQSANDLIQKQHRELSEAYDQLEQLARFDPLTGIPNRRYFHERLMLERDRFERTGKPFIMILGDIDNFKSVNDRFGHDAGDYVLVTVSQLMKGVLRKQDMIARWGGEEIIVLLPESNLVGGAIVGEKLRQAVENYRYIKNSESIPVAMTFGVSIYNGSISLADCIKRADEALYQGKKHGKNQVVLAPQD